MLHQIPWVRWPTTTLKISWRGGKNCTVLMWADRDRNHILRKMLSVANAGITACRDDVHCGDQDDPHFTTRGPEWHADAFHDAPGAEALLMLHGVGHGLGGIAGLDAKETEIEAPDGLEATKRLTLAWLQTALGAGQGAWPSACLALKGKAETLADVTQSQH